MAVRASAAALSSKTNCSDGSGPYASLIADKAGNLYGTTEYGGASDCFDGCGTVFKLARDGREKVLYTFCTQAYCPDGQFPVAPLVADKAGNLYSTTGFGGANFNGVVFELAPHGVETVLYAFTGESDGAEPQTGLVADKDVNLYGTTVAGGSKCQLQGGCGTIFRLAPKGSLTVLIPPVLARAD